ncbi:anti-sigma factor [Gordonia sp. SID5947]|nr:anti-sigma factor [Gordonia sp. SID5947]
MIDELMQSADTPVELRVAARSDRLPILRSVVERTLFIDDWTVDDVADINLGIDEVCAQLVSISAPEGELCVVLIVSPTGVVVRVEGEMPHEIDLDTSGFGWRVIETVTDSQSVSYSDVDRRRLATVVLAKRRARHHVA